MKPKFKQIEQAPHFGKMLRGHIKKHRLYRSVLGRMLGKANATLLAYEKRPSLQSSIIWELSTAMKHNFFADLAAQLPSAFTTYAPDATAPLQERIATLEQENKLLQAKLETLKELLKK